MQASIKFTKKINYKKALFYLIASTLFGRFLDDFSNEIIEEKLIGKVFHIIQTFIIILTTPDIIQYYIPRIKLRQHLSTCRPLSIQSGHHF